MKFKVRVFLGNRLIPEDEVPNLTIHAPVVDRIINTAVERNYMIIDDDSDDANSTE